MKNAIVLGTQFGDEGKGRTVSYLCSLAERPLVVRFNGGHQAGHTVKYRSQKHVCSQFGSGVLQEVPTLISKFCTMYPTSLITEFTEVANKTIHPQIYFNDFTAVTTPLDVMANRYDVKNIQHGTCGFGVGRTFERMKQGYNLYFIDLLFPHIFNTKLALITEYYSTLLGINISKDEMFQESLIRFKNAITTIQRHMNVNFFLEEDLRIDSSYDIIFEGAQGIMLDQQFGFFPHVTRSNTTSQNAIELLNEWAVGTADVFYITRPYQTRHGNGPLTGLGTPEVDNVDESNKNNRFQGEFKLRKLDLDLLNYAIRIDKLLHGYIIDKCNLVITCVDQLKDYRIELDGGKLHISKLPIFLDHLFSNIYYSFGPETNQIIKDFLHMGTTEETVEETTEEKTEETPAVPEEVAPAIPQPIIVTEEVKFQDVGTDPKIAITPPADLQIQVKDGVVTGEKI